MKACRRIGRESSELAALEEGGGTDVHIPWDCCSSLRPRTRVLTEVEGWDSSMDVRGLISSSLPIVSSDSCINWLLVAWSMVMGSWSPPAEFWISGCPFMPLVVGANCSVVAV